MLLNDFVTFPEASRPDDQNCFQAVVLGDNFIETDEVFAINISTFFPDLIGSPGSVLVTISRDGDSKFILQAINIITELTGSPLSNVKTVALTCYAKRELFSFHLQTKLA